VLIVSKDCATVLADFERGYYYYYLMVFKLEFPKNDIQLENTLSVILFFS